MKEILIFDTTLRDGEQTPGVSMNIDQKVQIALALENLGVDIMEAGFAASNSDDFRAIELISQEIKNSTVCSLARAIESDIKKAGLSIEKAHKSRIHTFIATSKIHMVNKLKLSEEEVIKKAVNAIEYSRTFTDDVEFSCEDAGRTDIGFLIEIIDAAINAGAKTINLPDTVGILMPSDIHYILKTVKDYVGNRAILSVHNHNDLGLGVANSLEAIKHGVGQIECTINGLGERAGNAALEEIVMAIDKRFANFYTNINKKEIYSTSKLVSDISNITPQANKAIIGKNAFLHESGIHQDGIIKDVSTYQIIDPEEIGYKLKSTLVLGKHSGRAAIKEKIEELGFHLDDEKINAIFDSFKELCLYKREVFDEDISALILDNLEKKSNERFHFKDIELLNNVNQIRVSLIQGNKIFFSKEEGIGIIDSIFKGIEKITNVECKLVDYKVESVTRGKDSLAKVNVVLLIDGKNYSGQSYNLDTVSASALAYTEAINQKLLEVS